METARALGNQMKLNKVVIACFKKDLFLVRPCVASVRYWYPDAEIFLLKDYIRGDFSTREIERYWGAKVFQTSRRVFGWPWSKLAVIMQDRKDKYLFLDSDTVMLGRVLDKLDDYEDDFVVTGMRGSQDSHTINAHYMDMQKVREFDPSYQFPGFGFNGGQMVMTSGMLSEADFASVIAFESNITNKHPDIFKHGDQGALNYVFAKAHQAGKITLAYADFWIWPGLPEASSIDLESIRRKEGLPFIIHWAGIKPTDFRKYSRYDVLKFYNDAYYRRVPLGGLKSFVRFYWHMAIVGLKIFKYKLLGMPYQ
jgi:hypothetical protein